MKKNNCTCCSIGLCIFGFKIAREMKSRKNAEKLLKMFKILNGYINFIEQN